ncbi:MAG: C4-dicarboxylic acid transporter DauA [Acidobacteria bacterium]|nr:C4-dicarboxylic acid transporter DauA [Acidobacteriota bacterium]
MKDSWLPKRYDIFTSFKVQPAFALREAFRAGYSASDFRADALAGIIVGIVALPLSMALAIASGVAPQHGLYTAIVAGTIIAVLGGSRTQISGPTAAFVVVLAPISAKFGLGGLLLASLMAGVMLTIFGVMRLGKFIEYVPYPVTTGFTSGIAVVIATLQFKDFLGLSVPHMPDEYLERVEILVLALPTTRWEDFVIGILTLTLLLVWPRLTKRIPAPLVALVVAALSAFLLRKYIPGFDVATIGSRFSYEIDGLKQAGIPRLPPLPALPWNFPGADGKPLVVTFHLIHELFPSACAIAMLGAIESLLSAVVADGMAGTQHDPDAELFAQGLGNMLSPFFGGFAATGAIARTATNIRAGGRSPIAAIVHALFVLLAVLMLAPVVAMLPMAALAALLLIVAWNMSEAKHFVHLLKVAPRSDVVVMLVCFLLTVVFDMVVGVSAGMVLASFLFMHWMARISNVQLIEDYHPTLREPLPKGTILYEIAGPLFFGAAQKAMATITEVADGTRTIILNIQSVPVMDATGLVNLQSLLDRLLDEKIYVIITGIQPQPATVLARARVRKKPRQLELCKKLETAVALAKVRADEFAEAERAARSTGFLHSLTPERLTKSLSTDFLKSLRPDRSTGSLSSKTPKEQTGSLPPNPTPSSDESSNPDRQTKLLVSEPPPKTKKSE